MIRTLKKQLYNQRCFYLTAVSLPLIGFFVYATLYHPAFFYLLALDLLVGLLYLFYIYQDMAQRRAGVELQKQDMTEKANLLDEEMNQEWTSIESYCKKILNYSQLKGLTEKLCVSFTLQETSAVLSSEVNKFFGDRDATVILYLFHSRTGELGLSASQKGEMRINVEAKKGDLYDQWVVKTLKPLLIEDIRTDFRFDADKLEGERSRAVRSLMSVPMCLGAKAVGILRVDSTRENYFTTEDVRLLNTIADLGAMAVENAQLYERIEDLAIRDSLTGLFLRRHFLERIGQEMARQLKRQQPLSFLMLDLDEFKQYNDRYGHPAGDIVLKTIGQILREMFSSPEFFICRYGGEEFAVLLPDCPKDEALVLAERLRERIQNQPVVLRRERTRVTVSIGVATFPDDAQLKEDLVAKADMAMYRAKATGRNRVCPAAP
ncbi:MAG TPA: sensor domain-containing diguanylate cyclase [Candidatus Omnitrophota bacterium]|nr:sensor domain-containing diguanylate cyclase [Candidatus Omnitrophota bacterium]HPN55362.1 sensor domain-containing diguanylate cyclase [Candidatus Omnitrophota bacterium]